VQALLEVLDELSKFESALFSQFSETGDDLFLGELLPRPLE